MLQISPLILNEKKTHMNKEWGEGRVFHCHFIYLSKKTIQSLSVIYSSETIEYIYMIVAMGSEP